MSTAPSTTTAGEIEAPRHSLVVGTILHCMSLSQHHVDDINLCHLPPRWSRRDGALNLPSAHTGRSLPTGLWVCWLWGMV